MREPSDDRLPPSASRTTDKGVAIAIAITILICIVAFVWIFVELDPFLDDFTGSDVILTPDPTELEEALPEAESTATVEASP